MRAVHHRFRRASGRKTPSTHLELLLAAGFDAARDGDVNGCAPAVILEKKVNVVGNS